MGFKLATSMAEARLYGRTKAVIFELNKITIRIFLFLCIN